MKFSSRVYLGLTVVIALTAAVFACHFKSKNFRLRLLQKAQEGVYFECYGPCGDCLNFGQSIALDEAGFPFLLAGTRDEFSKKSHFEFLNEHRKTVTIVVLVGDGWKDAELITILKKNVSSTCVTDSKVGIRLKSLRTQIASPSKIRIINVTEDTWKEKLKGYRSKVSAWAD